MAFTRVSVFRRCYLGSIDNVGGLVLMRYEYKGAAYTINELAEMSGIAQATIRYRLRKGYSVSEAVKMLATDDGVREFVDASCWEDWIGMPISGLYKIYWKWCVSYGYTPLHIKGFSRQLFQMFPNLKTVPNRVDGKCLRVIRMRG